MLCRRSFHCDGSPSLRLFALGLRANKSRLLGPCCLGGSPSRFIDQARGVLLFVFSFSLIFIFCFLIFLFSFASPCGGVLFLLLVSRDVSSFLLSSHFLASVLVSCLRCVHRWYARSSSRVAFSASAVCVVLTLGSCSVLLANSMLRQSLEGNLQSITVSSAHCLVRLAGCPLHSA